MNFSGISIHSPDIGVCQPNVYGDIQSHHNMSSTLCILSIGKYKHHIQLKRLKKRFTQIVCTYCGRQLTREERVKNGFGIYKLNEKTGHLIEEHEVNSIYEGNKITGLSVSSLKIAADKGNAIITRRKDKQRFILCWQNIHERCFQIRKEESG